MPSGRVLSFGGSHGPTDVRKSHTDRFSPELEHENPELEKNIREIFETRGRRLEEFSQALLEELGGSVQGWELVEQWGPDRITWYFQRRK